MSSRPASDGGSTSMLGGSRDAGTKYYPRTEIVRLPSGSIARIPIFELAEAIEPSLHEFSLVERALLVFTAAASFFLLLVQL